MLHSRPQSRDMAAWNINKVRSIQLAEVNKIVGLKSFLLKNRKVKVKKKELFHLNPFLKFFVLGVVVANSHMLLNA